MAWEPQSQPIRTVVLPAELREFDSPMSHQRGTGCRFSPTDGPKVAKRGDPSSECSVVFRDDIHAPAAGLR